MVSRKSIVKNELMKALITIRIDTLWKMIGQKTQGLLPATDDEGATGKFDNKGAIFLPGGLIYQDVDEQFIHYDIRGHMKSAEFRERIQDSMRFDNATLMYPDGLAPGINLDGGFFSKAARRILTYKKASFRRKKTIGKEIARDISSHDIIRSHCPPYMKPPYGARTRISTCIAVGLVDPPMYFAFCKAHYNFYAEQARWFAAKLDRAVEPALSKDGDVLYPPYVIICHDTRYKENSYTGLTRILGIGKFGEFATLTIEQLTKQLTDELRRKKLDIKPEDHCATYNGASYALLLRCYAPTNPGKRSLTHELQVISPQRDLGLDMDKIEKDARSRYRIPESTQPAMDGAKWHPEDPQTEKMETP